MSNNEIPPAAPVSDDELDDLDDVLDEFDQSTKPEPTKTPPPSTVPLSIPELEDDFAKKLQSGMDELLREMNQSPAARAEFEKLVQGIDQATMGPNDVSKSIPPKESRSFQDTITETMKRMKDSDAEIEKEVNNEDAFLAEMLQQLSQAGGQGGDEAGFEKMLEGMMEELMSKDLLYEPMKELAEKYPAWLTEQEGKLSEEEIRPYREQYEDVRQVLAKFDSPSYSERDEGQRREIAELMNQAYYLLLE
ncbi:Peroxisome biogenesis protein 19-1 [Neolecta irregularis DAH-3]|uniref:Peroxisome biogenesis protein 19-1 n=1 Tax=Neolecta irregularis (strain DAH-3) TaxID=1198029 RepID=A0A1U7LIG7_NEOID|nr:Peroxisome biogenesis protein 19-1 [Neolecta irregularis DAH-3]|eukprot:OLL22342.1 Peroxisome biogenesis protein 19-1 [Neolecta irregularis DAH-3]